MDILNWIITIKSYTLIRLSILFETFKDIAQQNFWIF